MRIGAPLLKQVKDPKEWTNEHLRRGYLAAYCPDLTIQDTAEIRAYRQAARDADIVIAEVGAWSNPLSDDAAIRQSALQRCKEQLALTEEIGAICCVNIAGSRSAQWDGPHPDNFTPDTFALIVDNVRDIIDAVKPKTSYFTLEVMPWIFPNDAETYLSLMKAIDREAFGVHLDPVNMIASPALFFHNRKLLLECFMLLGPYIRSCHAKDVVLSSELTVHLSEVRPGLGGLDYYTYLKLLRSLNRDVPLMLEHLLDDEAYQEAAKFILYTASRI
ncbi:sugar phosphate isomerase/epimerase family protein [Paenibacillus oryzisoli]|uniref:Xylose isomerase n=1 Tax=Paenibacillus oryzisoli TaxID=1850517 RepID=A0A198AGX9_9BACL|nr:sugar phosphate isomerase/epimerase [Paenibacillus oryzisoli]OAS20487.1 xylose isomerase [Paenibacillus oryzisoli]